MRTVALIIALSSSLAQADDNADNHVANLLEVADGDNLDHHVDAPTQGIEIGVATGYTRGVGSIGDGMQRIEDISRSGASVELDAMYRINARFAVGVYFSLARYATVEQIGVLGAGAGFQAVAHLRPDRSADPWVSLATGWRSLAVSAEGTPNGSLQGFDLARVQLGLDYRVNENVAIAPVVGASLSAFVVEESPDRFTEISDKTLSVVGFAGLAGRFDLR
jgi:hypothetical protein